MAEALVRLTDTESIISGHSDVIEYGLAFDEIREEEIQEDGQDRKRQRKDKTDAFCDVCLMHYVIALSKNVAFNLCYLCEQYLCDECFKGHESHVYNKLVSEKSESKTRKREFLREMRNESEREEKFERENVSMVDIVNVKYRLDRRDCFISGLCGLNNTRWVVSDFNNNCIKLFNVGSNLLQRYIRLGSKPWDVTEIKVKSEATAQGIMSKSDISVMNQVKPDKQCLLAVTLPRERKILIIDVTQNPSAIFEFKEMEKRCYSIDFNGDHIFTVCCDDDGPWFVSVMSTDRVTIININTHLPRRSLIYLAACPGRFYITDERNHKVLCMNIEGTVISHKTIEGSPPLGISVDPDTNLVYICASRYRKLYRLDSNLKSLEPLFDLESSNLDFPRDLCLYRDKLYVGYGLWTTDSNFVTVVRVL